MSVESNLPAEAEPKREVQAPDSHPELLARREQLIERFALMQSELGGLFYEMAIRDHVELDVLVAKAAALQRVDLELTDVERQLNPPAL